MNVAQLQLALGRLTSPAAAEKPDLAGYEAQGEFLDWAWGVLLPTAQPWAGMQGCDRRATRGWGAGSGKGLGSTGACGHPEPPQFIS